MNIHLLSIIFTLLALSGAIIVGIVMGKSKIDTVWCSKLGAWAIIGLIIMGVGLTGAMFLIVDAPPTITDKLTQREIL